MVPPESATTLPAARPPGAGAQDPRIGPYVILGRIARGGMGEVFLALAPDGGQVALKLLAPTSDETLRTRFEREGRLLAGLDHPCLVRVLDKGFDAPSNRPYLVMRLVLGRDLDEVLAARPDRRLDLSEAAHVVDRVAQALAMAHARGVIHRDVKPGNVLLTPDGQVLLGDFGIALDDDVSVRLTRDELLGTPAYLAPEVILGEPWTPAADLHALGALVFQLLTGKPPFGGASAEEVLSDRLARDAPPLSSVLAEIPDAWDELVVSLLAREPVDRMPLARVRGVLSPFIPEDPARLERLRADAAPQRVAAPPELAVTVLEPARTPAPPPDLAATVVEPATPAVATPAADLAATVVDSSSATTGALAAPTSTTSASTTSPSAVVPLVPTVPVGRGRGLVAGDTFLHYRLEGELGRGAMGVVFRAFHEGLKKPVALKVLQAGALARPDDQRRFLREAQAAGALAHPYVVPVLDAGEHEGTFFLTMELVKGVPLSKALGPDATLRQRIELVVRLCQGVQHAHTRGVIHRDLKPDNVLVSEDGAPHILDFGLARTLDTDEEAQGDSTREGAVVGTLRYMAPEQASGKPTEVDVRSDVYALGTILYESLCGTTPFRGTTREVISQVLFQEPAPPSSHRPGLQWELDAICRRALDKDKETRYQSALELAQDLERFLKDEPVLAGAGSLASRLVKWARRNRPRLIAWSVFAAAGLALLGVWASSMRRLQRERIERVLEATRAGWEHLGKGESRAAAETFTLARAHVLPDDRLVLDAETTAALPASLREALPHEEREAARVNSDRLRAWADFAAAAERRAEVERRLTAAAAAREAAARGDAAALDALRRAVESAAALAEDDYPQVARLRQDLAARYLALAREHLDALAASPSPSDLPARRTRLERARELAEEARRSAPDLPEVLATVATVHEELGRQAQLEQAAALQERQAARCRELVVEGEAALAKDELDVARRAFEQAVGFDGRSEPAQSGLLRVHELQGARARAAEDATRAAAREEADRARVARVAELRAQANDALVEGRARFARGELPADVRERYLTSMEHLRQALFLSPGDAEATASLERVARELSVVLIDQGEPELAGFILRIGGASGGAAPQTELPRDPHVAVIEADRVGMRRALGGNTHFLPTYAFDRVREYVRSQNPSERLRFTIEVRSEIVQRAGQTLIYARGLRIRMEDRQAGTVSAPTDIDFEGGPYPRPITVSPQGLRQVKSFDQAQGIDAARWVAQAHGVIQNMVQRARSR